jgi:hypothetical protein
VGTYVLFALYAVAASVVITLLFKRLWRQQHLRAIQERWGERERLLDRPRTRPRAPEILAQRSRPTGTRDPDPLRRPQIVNPETFARVLFIVARDQRELVGFLHKDFAAEEADGVIEILMDRRQSPQWHGTQPREADGRRNPHRNRSVTTNLREIGCALVCQPVPIPEIAPPMTHVHDTVAFGA